MFCCVYGFGIFGEWVILCWVFVVIVYFICYEFYGRAIVFGNGFFVFGVVRLYVFLYVVEFVCFECFNESIVD